VRRPGASTRLARLNSKDIPFAAVVSVHEAGAGLYALLRRMGDHTTPTALLRRPRTHAAQRLTHTQRRHELLCAQDRQGGCVLPNLVRNDDEKCVVVIGMRHTAATHLIL